MNKKAKIAIWILSAAAVIATAVLTIVLILPKRHAKTLMSTPEQTSSSSVPSTNFSSAAIVSIQQETTSTPSVSTSTQKPQSVDPVSQTAAASSKPNRMKSRCLMR